MAIVLVRFDGGNVPVVTGDIPPDDRHPDQRVRRRQSFETNQAVHRGRGRSIASGSDTPIAHTPLWQVVQAIDGVPAEIAFRRKRMIGRAAVLLAALVC